MTAARFVQRNIISQHLIKVRYEVIAIHVFLILQIESILPSSTLGHHNTLLDLSVRGQRAALLILQKVLQYLEANREMWGVYGFATAD